MWAFCSISCYFLKVTTDFSGMDAFSDRAKYCLQIFLCNFFCFRIFHNSWNDLNWYKIYESRKKNSAFFVQVSCGSFVKKGCINTGRDDPTFLILSDEPKHEGMHVCTIVQLLYIIKHMYKILTNKILFMYKTIISIGIFVYRSIALSP